MKIFTKVSTSLLLSALMLLFFSRCIDNSDYDFNRLAEFRWNPDLAIPLVYGNLSIENLLNDEDSANLRTDQDGLYYIVFEDTIESRTVSDLIEFLDINFSRNYLAIPGVIPAGSSSVVIEQSGFLEFDMDPEEITKLVAKAGTLDYSLTSSLNAITNVQLSFPHILDGDDSLVFLHELGSGNTEVNGNSNLADTIFELDQTPQQFNKFRFNLKVTVEAGNQPVTVLATDVINLSLNFRDIDYLYIEGYFGQQEIDVAAETVEIGFSGDFFNDAQIQLNNADITLSVVNDYGVPVEVDFERLDAIYESGRTAIETDPASPILVNGAETPGDIARTDISVLNAVDIFNNRAEQIDYKVVGTINPDGVRRNNFLSSDSKIDVLVDARVPLYGSAYNIHLSDTVEFDVLSSDDEVDVENALLYVRLENGFPIEGTYQIFFTNDDYEVIDSLFSGVTQTNLQPGAINTNGDVISPGIYDEVLNISSQKVENLRAATHMIFTASLNTNQNSDGSYPHVKIKSDYKIAMNCKLQTRLNLTVKP